jgi:hypothetical protein
MLIFGNMADGEENKLAIVLECMEIDHPRSPKDYIASQVAWDMADLIVYRERKKREQASHRPGQFRLHP